MEVFDLEPYAATRDPGSAGADDPESEVGQSERNDDVVRGRLGGDRDVRCRQEGCARAEDLIATLTEVTAASVQRAFRWIPFDVDAVYLCGGGARNPELMRRIAADLDPIPVRSVDDLGWDGDAREAAAFALFARQHLLGIPLDLGWATGSEGPRILGKRVPA